MNRRDLLRSTAGTALGAAVLGSWGCATKTGARRQLAPVATPGGVGDLSTARHLAPVIVDPAREIRTVVGLRPFRTSGYRVDTERLDGKVVVHNYGHGGAGITLSWGTAHLAVEHAMQTDRREAAVLGCGAVGLATARLLQQRGWQVTIYAKDLPPNTTSNIAGGQWSPHLVADPGLGSPGYEATFVRAARLAHRHFQDLPRHRYGIRWLENYFVGDAPMELPEQDLADLFPDTRRLTPADHPFPGAHAFRYTTMLIETSTYLDEMLRDVRLAGGEVVVRELRGRRDLAALPELVIVNCTGLGSRELFGDAALLPVRGQLTYLLPQPEVDYMVVSSGLYMFPRQDGILLGGTHERGVESLVPDPEAKARILSGHRRLFGWQAPR